MTASIYRCGGLITSPHLGRDRSVIAECTATGDYAALLDAAGDDHVESPRMRPGPPGTVWVIDLAPHAAADQAVDDVLRGLLADHGWTVL